MRGGSRARRERQPRDGEPSARPDVAHRGSDAPARRRRPSPWPGRRRLAAMAATDCLAWALGLAGVVALRLGGDLGARELHGLAEAILVAIVLQLVVGTVGGLYRGLWRVASFEEVAAIARITFVVALLLELADLVAPRPVPASAPVFGAMAAFLLSLAARYLYRLSREHRRHPRAANLQRLVVFGAGDTAAQVLPQLLHRADSTYLPVALLDDDPAKRRLVVAGVRVEGTRDDLAAVAATHGATTLLVAMVAPPPALLRALAEQTAAAGLELRVLPRLRELLEGSASPLDLRTPSARDLLGRPELAAELDGAAGYLIGKRVLVTGAGGSIGAELCRQLRRYGPAELVMVDRDESALHALQLSLEGRALLDSAALALVDIRDAAAVDLLFAERRPETVFHAAALKHLPMLERHPAEAVKTNVWGTLNLLEAAARHGTETFVNISTDKAADPTSVLGYTKRIGERLTAGIGCELGRRFVSVRFGNVLGSRGSVYGTFQAQIAAGGPVTVTHPEVRRYFMTVEEAVQLVLRAGAIGRPGEVLVLDMGDPVRILDVATRMIAESRRAIEIVFTGLRPGEKLTETLLGEDEPDRRDRHPLISQVPCVPLEPAEARALDVTDVNSALTEALASLALRSVTASGDGHAGSASAGGGEQPGATGAGAGATDEPDGAALSTRPDWAV